jgi:MFS family permease
MSQPPTSGASRAQTPAPDPQDASTGQLAGQLSELVTRLVRDEVRLAQAEVTGKAKRLGVGAGLFGSAGLVALFGLAALITAAILALALVLPAWLAALIVAVVLCAIAGVLALVGKKNAASATPLLPTEAISSAKTDVAAVKQGMSR